MAALESLEEFYKKNQITWLPDDLRRDLGHFNVFRLEECIKPGAAPMSYSRREFYKVTLIRGSNRYHYADKSIEVAGSTLIFFNPKVPYTWEGLSEDTTGCFCIFTDAFFSNSIRGGISGLPMFAASGKPAYTLTPRQDEEVSLIFSKMLDEIGSDYAFKYDLIRNYINELIHIALKLEPSDTLYKHPDASSRITSVFTELLERQFPIESPSQRFSMRSARDFANELAVHVNHLNRAIKVTTGKTTTHHIAERLAAEARALLRHTDWNISEIGYSLGFEEPAHFNNFFRKQTLMTPSAYRVV